jgi:hypothetical protein
MGDRSDVRDILGFPFVPPAPLTRAVVAARRALGRAHRAAAPASLRVLESLFGLFDNRVLGLLVELREGPGRERLSGEGGDDELPLVVETDDPVPPGQNRIERGEAGVDVGFELGQADVGIGWRAGQLTELVSQRCPPVGGDQVGGGIGVASGTGDPHVAGAQCRLEAVEDGHLPVVAVDRSTFAFGSRRLEAGAPPGGHEVGGGVVGDPAPPGGVELAQDLDGAEQRVGAVSPGQR